MSHTYLPFQTFNSLEECQLNNWKVHFFFYIFTWLVSQNIMSLDMVIVGHRKSRFKWKPRPLRLSQRLKGWLSPFLFVFGSLFQGAKYTLLNSIKTADAVMSHVCMYTDAVQSFSSWRNETWACNISFMDNTTLSNMVDQTNVFLQKKAANLSLYF